MSHDLTEMVTIVVASDISSPKCQQALQWTAAGDKVFFPH